MIAHPSLLAVAAREAGIKLPEDIDADFESDEYPHWFVFLSVQTGLRMPSPGCHFENAKIVAAIPEDEIRLVTISMLRDLGFSGL